MNTPAAIKTLLVVLAIGAWTGYGEWRQVYGRDEADHSARLLARCVVDGRSASYRAHPHMMGRDLDASYKEIEARCRLQARADVPAAATSPAGPTYATDVQAQKEKQSQPHRPAKTAPDAAATEPITTRLDKCMERIEEARKRSPGGLNPEWEQGERDRCKAL